MTSSWKYLDLKYLTKTDNRAGQKNQREKRDLCNSSKTKFLMPKNVCMYSCVWIFTSEFLYQFTWL